MKAGLWMKFITRANRKRLVRTQALKKLHNEIKQLKKVSSKSTQGHITTFEKRILETLKEGGFIEGCEESVAPAKSTDEEQSTTPSEQLHEGGSQEVSQEVSMEQTLSREERVQQIEAEARARAAQQYGNLPIKDLQRILDRLERIRKKIKVSGGAEKEQLKSITERSNALKEKIAVMSGMKKVRAKKVVRIVRKKKSSR